MTWNVPSQNTTLDISTFLPTGVTENPGKTAFLVNVDSVSITRTLGADCSACATFDGAVIPKPQFTGGGSGNASLPASVTAATLAGDTLSVTITNGFDFDPIRPTAAAAGDTGWVTTVVTSGSTVIGKDSINGQTDSLPSNKSTTLKIPLSGVVNTAGGVTVTVTVQSPIGDLVQIHANETIKFVATVGTLQISSATVSLGTPGSPTTVTPGSPSTVDLSGISNSIAKSVNNGMFILTITNPLGVAGSLTANFTGGGGSVSKALTLSSAATSTDTLSFSNSDLTTLLGYSQQLTFSGTVSGAAITITPGQTLAVTSRLQINVETVSNQ